MTEIKKIVLGSRRSALARCQAEMVKKTIEQNYDMVSVETKFIATKGDEDQYHEGFLPKFGQKGLFTHELELMLDSEEIDLAVHSLKDVPAELENKYLLSGFLKRDFPHDALLIRENYEFRREGFFSLPFGCSIGTASARRKSQIIFQRPDLRVVSLRGNVDTRINKLRSGEVDAIILACAGLNRLKRSNEIDEILSTDEFLPAPGQGVIALQSNRKNVALTKFIDKISDFETYLAVFAERTFVSQIGATCGTPIAVFAKFEKGEFSGDLYKDSSEQSEIVIAKDNDLQFNLKAHCYDPEGQNRYCFEQSIFISHEELKVDLKQQLKDKIFNFTVNLANKAKLAGAQQLMGLVK